MGPEPPFAPPTSSPGSGGSLCAILTLLPATLLVVPPGWLSDDPHPHLAGTGLVCLASLPLAVLLLARRGARVTNALVLLLLAWFAGAAAARLSPTTDTFELRRALVGWSACMTLFLGGASLDEQGRRWLLRGLLSISLVATLWALGRGWEDPLELAGVLGNTGPLSQTALPGALVGAFFLANERGPWRVLGAGAVLAFAVHAGWAPVLAGALAFVAAILCALVRGVRESRSRRVLALAAALTLTAAVLPRFFPQPRTSSDSSADAGDLGGLGVRLLLWQRVPAILAAHPLGVGPGQFQASFPPLRDARERARSDGDGVFSEVEHLHDDLLHGFAEWGLAGGIPWLAFLALAASAAWRDLRPGRPDATRPVVATALLGLLVNGLVHTPLTVQPASSALGFVLLGSVLARRDVGSSVPLLRPGVTRWLPVATLLGAFYALPLVRQGTAMRDYIAAARRIDRRLNAIGGIENMAGDPLLASAARDAHAALSRAREAAPDAAPVLRLWARQAQPEAHVAAWEALLARRPHDYEALVQLGRALAQAGRVREAEACFQHARELAPERSEQ